MSGNGTSMNFDLLGIAAGRAHAGAHRCVADIVEIVDRDGLADEILGVLDRAVAGRDDGGEIMAALAGRRSAGRDADELQALGLGDQHRGHVAEAELHLARQHARNDGGAAAGGGQFDLEILLGEEALA